jgi:hypothetical protein
MTIKKIINNKKNTTAASKTYTAVMENIYLDIKLS